MFFIVFVKSVVGLFQNKLFGFKWVPKWVPNLALVGHFWGHFLDHFFGHFLDHFWGPFWGPFSDQISQRGSKMSPRGPSRASKTNKATFSKKWFSRETVCIFSLLRPPKRASRGPRRLPRGTQRTPKPQKKGIQN